MSEAKKPAQAPRAVIEQRPSAPEADAAAAAPAEAATREPAPSGPSLQDATVGMLRRAGLALWSYAGKHPYAVGYGCVAFVLAVLVLVIGLWDTIVIAVFVLVGVTIGQMRDGDNAIVNFFSRLFDGHR